MNRISAFSLLGTLAAAALAASSPALAANVGDGTVSSVQLFNPTVTLGDPDSTYTANGATFEISGTGQFANVGGTMGTLSGMLTFSDTPGETIDQTLPDFFVFSDGSGGSYNFSVSSVEDLSYSTSSSANAFALYVLGQTTDPSQNLGASPTSLTLSFNNNGGSAYSSSATLSIPPAGVSAAPEPGTWMLMVAGIGLIGAAFRFGRRYQAFATA